VEDRVLLLQIQICVVIQYDRTHGASPDRCASHFLCELRSFGVRDHQQVDIALHVIFSSGTTPEKNDLSGEGS
jgi:hypothetical protein